jgi:tyrosyl-tRNA synthetase
MPLLEGLDGVNKMSKSLGNYIGITEPATQIFAKVMSISDELMWRYLELLSFQSAELIATKKSAVKQGSNPRDIKFDFASEITERFHGRNAAQLAAKDFIDRSKGGIPDEVPKVTITISQDAVPIALLLKQAGLVTSTSEGLRSIDQGGVKLDGEKITDKGLTLARGVTVVAQVGKRKFARVKIV